MAPAVGDLAPDFTLTDHHGEAVTLSELRGTPVALVFFPLAFTGRCTGELCELRDSIAMFDDASVQLLAISVDSHATLARFAEEEGYGFRLLSDFWPHGEVAKAYDAFLPERGIATRATFLIDAEGRIVETFRTSPGEARDLESYRAALAGIAG